MQSRAQADTSAANCQTVALGVCSICATLNLHALLMAPPIQRSAAEQQLLQENLQKFISCRGDANKASAFWVTFLREFFERFPTDEYIIQKGLLSPKDDGIPVSDAEIQSISREAQNKRKDVSNIFYFT